MRFTALVRLASCRRLLRLSFALALFWASTHVVAWPVYVFIYSFDGFDVFSFDSTGRLNAIDEAWPAEFREAMALPEPTLLRDGWVPNLFLTRPEPVYVNIGRYPHHELDRVMGATRGRARIFVPPGLHGEFALYLSIWPTYGESDYPVGMPCCCFFWFCTGSLMYFPPERDESADVYFGRAMVLYGYQETPDALRRPRYRGGTMVLGTPERAGLAARGTMILRNTRLISSFFNDMGAFAMVIANMTDPGRPTRQFTWSLVQRGNGLAGMAPTVGLIISFLAPEDIGRAFGTERQPLRSLHVALHRAQDRVLAPPSVSARRRVPAWRQDEVDDDGVPLLQRSESRRSFGGASPWSGGGGP